MVWMIGFPDSTSPDDFTLVGGGLTDSDRLDFLKNGPNKPDIVHAFVRDSVTLHQVMLKSKNGTMPSALAVPPKEIRAKLFAFDKWEELKRKNRDVNRPSVSPPPLPFVQQQMEQEWDPISHPDDDDLPDSIDDLPESERDHHHMRIVEEVTPHVPVVVQMAPAQELQQERYVKGMRSIVTHQTRSYVFATYYDTEKGGQRRVVIDYDDIKDEEGKPTGMSRQQELKFAVLWFDGICLPATETDDGIEFDFVAESAVFKNQWIPGPLEYAEILEMMDNVQLTV